MALVIVEGCDGSGKTTLVQRARAECKRYFWAAQPSRPPKTIEQILEGSRWLAMALNFPSLDVILDRHPYISEPIYGPILRGVSVIPSTARTPLLKSLIGQTERFIYCRPPRAVITDNVTRTAKDQLAGVVLKHLLIVDAYDHVMREILRLGGKVFWYDYTFSKRSLEALLFGDPIHGEHNEPTAATDIL